MGLDAVFLQVASRFHAAACAAALAQHARKHPEVGQLAPEGLARRAVAQTELERSTRLARKVSNAGLQSLPGSPPLGASGDLKLKFKLRDPAP